MKVIRTYEVTFGEKTEAFLEAVAEGVYQNITSIDFYDACTRVIDAGDEGTPLYLVKWGNGETGFGEEVDVVANVDQIIYGPIRWDGREEDVDLEH